MKHVLYRGSVEPGELSDDVGVVQQVQLVRVKRNGHYTIEAWTPDVAKVEMEEQTKRERQAKSDASAAKAAETK